MVALEGTLSLDRGVLVEVVDDPSDDPAWVVSGTSGSIGSGTAKKEEISRQGEFREYGNGNVRLITGASVKREQTLALRAVTSSQLEVVKSLQGQNIVYRDTYGRRIFGAFIDLEVEAIPHSGRHTDDTLLYDVGLKVRSVTYDEEV